MEGWLRSRETRRNGDGVGKSNIAAEEGPWFSSSNGVGAIRTDLFDGLRRFKGEDWRTQDMLEWRLRGDREFGDDYDGTSRVLVPSRQGWRSVGVELTGRLPE